MIPTKDLVVLLLRHWQKSYHCKLVLTKVKAQNGRAEIDKPQSIFLYNKGMGGVDRLGKNIKSYMIGHCSKKWW